MRRLLQKIQILVLVSGIFTFISPFSSAKAQEVELQHFAGFQWTISPFKSGFSLLEPTSVLTYGSYYPDGGYASFPELPVKGVVTIPVFLVDWSDFNPQTDESNHSNPNSTLPGYQQKTPADLDAFLNNPQGLSGYFDEVSGGELQVHFEVHPWMVSDDMTYLQDKEPSYYYQNFSGAWNRSQTTLAEDVLRSAIADMGIDLTNYDADNNKVLDGFVIVYEGRAGALSGTNLSSIEGYWNSGPSPFITMRNAAELVPTSDPNYALFSTQQILYNRYNNIPEQSGATHQFTVLGTWAHELGHLLLGYRDYYHAPTSLGKYALSALGGHPRPFHPAAMEKWLFAKWVDTKEITSVGVYSLTNHFLNATQFYLPEKDYLFKILIDKDPQHFLTVENSYFLPPIEGGSFFNEESPGDSPESGLLIFEIDQRLTTSDQIKRLVPDRVIGTPMIDSKGAFQPGDELIYTDGNFSVQITNISVPDEVVSFDVYSTALELPASYPWKENENGALYTGFSWNYALGYQFTPQKDGFVTQLGGLFDGTKTVRLFHLATGEQLAETQVVSVNAWSYSDVSPVLVVAGETYTVAAYLAGSGGSYRTNIVTFPQTYGDIVIEGSTYAYTGTNPDVRPTNTYPYNMYGQVDIKFVANR
jgi:M6 family metalloprotease-like protein